MAKNVIGLDILAMRTACEKMEPYQRTDCPNCGYNLETSIDDILHCKFCGYQDSYPLVRDIEKV